MIIAKALNQLRILKRSYLSRIGRAPKSKAQLKLKKERHGSDYGGWVILQNSVSPSSVIYSFGIGKDISFDLSLIKEYGVNIYAFDPTPDVKKWLDTQNLPFQFHYYPLAISNKDERLKFNTPNNINHISHSAILPNKNGSFIEVKAQRLVSIMKDLHHTHIDILKMDIEGSEYNVIKDILSSKISISQILVEFHHFFENISVEDTNNIISEMNKAGYKIFYTSPTGREYSFVKLR